MGPDANGWETVAEKKGGLEGGGDADGSSFLNHELKVRPFCTAGTHVSGRDSWI